MGLNVINSLPAYKRTYLIMSRNSNVFSKCFFIQILFIYWMSISIIIMQFKTHMYIYSLSFADCQVVLAQDHDDMEYMARKLKEGYVEWGLTINLEKTKYICIGERKGSLKLEGGK